MNTKNINITKVTTVKVRNMLRGIIGETDSFKIKKILKKIKNNGTYFEYKKSVEIIRENELFKSNPVARNFNKACPKGLPDLVKFNKNEILDKINSQENRINDLLRSYKEVSDFIQIMDFKNALNSCSRIIDNEGVSCYLIRIIFYIKNHAEYLDGYKEIFSIIDDLLFRIEIANVSYLANAIRELSNPRTDYFKICAKINNSDSKAPLTYIAKNFITNTISNEDDFLNTFNAYYSFSLLDSFLYFASTHRLNLSFTKDIKTISPSILDSFNLLAKVKVNPLLYLHKEYDSLDISLFRECFLLIEINELFKYKTIHGFFYNTNDSTVGSRPPIEKQLISNYFEDVNDLSDLRNRKCITNKINLEKYNANHCSFLENSNALLYSISKNDADILDEEEKFIQLMSYTRDIGSTCPTHYLQKIKNNAVTDELKLVLSCLISIKDNSQIVEHSLRKIIQEITISKFNSKIKGLVEYIHTISPSVTYHLIQICDETFLSKLFHVITMPNKAIEERADMLEWYGNKIKDSSYIERAKNLRIDVQISKEKGTIDDSRIYVDPLKFTQWINDNVMNDLDLLLELSSIKNENISAPSNWSTVQSGITYSEQIATLLLKCYSEFCNNKLFGIASYLGRRIRHGTFKGTGLKEVKDFSTNKKYVHIFSNRELLDCYNTWVESYEDMLEDLKKSYLHIHNKKNLSV